MLKKKYLYSLIAVIAILILAFNSSIIIDAKAEKEGEYVEDCVAEDSACSLTFQAPAE